MAVVDGNAFALPNIPDNSDFVHKAMHVLGFFCEFSDLTTEQIQLALAVAQFLKQNERQPEFWES